MLLCAHNTYKHKHSKCYLMDSNDFWFSFEWHPYALKWTNDRHSDATLTLTTCFFFSLFSGVCVFFSRLWRSFNCLLECIKNGQILRLVISMETVFFCWSFNWKKMVLLKVFTKPPAWWIVGSWCSSFLFAWCCQV